MPRIEEYLPETEGSGPVGGLDPKTEAVGRIGAGIEKIGTALEESGAKIYHQESSAEVADASVSSSQRSVDFNQRLINETQDGSLDIDKFKQDYQTEIDNERSQYKTAAGRNYFDRVSARMGSKLTISAMHGRQQIAGREAANAWDEVSNSRAVRLTQDPSSFSEIQAQTEEDIQARVDAGGLSAKDAPKLLKQASAENFVSAIRGYNKLGDTGRVDKDGKPIDGPALAKHILDSGDAEGYLNPAQLHTMYGEIKLQAHANKAEVAQNLRDQKLEQEKRLDDWYSKTASRIGQVKATEVAGNPDIPGHVQWQIIAGLNAQATKASRPDPAVVTEMTDRMMLPDDDPNKIVNPQELLNKVDAPTYQRIMGYYNKSEDGKAANGLRLSLWSGAKKQIIPTDPVSLANNVAHPGNLKVQNDNYLRFQIEYHQAEKQLILDKTPLSELTNPDSKNYFFKTHPIENYKVKNPLAAGAKQLTDEAINNAPDGSLLRKPGETIEQLEARKAEARKARH